MANPYIQVNKKSWDTILKSFSRSVILIADTDPAFDSSKIEPFVAQYVAVINANSEEIFALAASGIQQYINFYKISPREGIYDEFKNIYFLGMAISAKLDACGLADLNKLHQKAIVRLLDLRLQVPHKAYREALSKRIVSAINNNTVMQHFGSYGWYFIYKCLFNAASSPKKPTI